MQRLRAFRIRWSLCGLLQIHHIVPRCVHATLAPPAAIPVDDPDNLMFMPTRSGARRMRLRADRLLHDGGHPAYNAYVRERAQNATNLSLLMDELRAGLRRADPDLPWP